MNQGDLVEEQECRSRIVEEVVELYHRGFLLSRDLKRQVEHYLTVRNRNESSRRKEYKRDQRGDQKEGSWKT